MQNELTDLEKAHIVMQAAIGHITDDESFEIAVCGCKSAGMPDNEIIEYLKQSPKFDKEAVTRVKSFKAEGGRTVASLIKLAKDTIGFQPPWAGNHGFNWRMNLSSYPTYTPQIVSASTVPAIASSLPKLQRYGTAKVPFERYSHLSGIEQLKIFFSVIRKDGDLSQIATSYNGPGRKLPLLSLDDILSIESVADLEAKITMPFSDSGAWVVKNPVGDAEGNDHSVIDHRFLLWEQDKVPLKKQYGAIKDSKLPIAAVTYSGGKSLHALIEVNAKSAEEHEEIARRVFAVFDRHSADYDKSVKNPGRLTRLPGLQRGEQMQQLIALREDFPNAFSDIQTWLEYEESGTRLPIAEYLDEDGDEDEDEDYIIGDIVAQGDLFCIGGGSKVGKSFCAMSLAAELIKPSGGKWLNFPITPKADGTGYKVFYINTEIKKRSFKKRMKTLLASSNSAEYKKNIIVLHLRGFMELFKAWKTDLIKQVTDFGADFLIMDPIYPIIDGDENLTADMKEFINNLKNIQVETNTTLPYTHHHRKGDLRDEEPRDRLAGSGVVARSYDALMDITGINDRFLRNGGIETKTTDEHGNDRYSVRAVRIEFDLRGEKDYFPMNFWRDGGEYVKDQSGVIQHAWDNGLKSAFNMLQLSVVRGQLGDKISVIDSEGGNSGRRKTKTRTAPEDENSAANQCAKVKILDRVPKIGKPHTLQEIMKLCDITGASTARDAINQLIKEGDLEITEDGQQGVKGAGKKYYVTEAYLQRKKKKVD